MSVGQTAMDAAVKADRADKGGPVGDRGSQGGAKEEDKGGDKGDKGGVKVGG